MRTLSETLTAKQKYFGGATVGPSPRLRIALTHPTLTDYTYYITDRILKVSEHKEEPWDQHAAFTLTNYDQALTDVNLEGYKVVISWGYNTASGDEYSASAPLWIIPQDFTSAPNKLTCDLYAVGIPNLMAMDRASANYSPSFFEAADAPSNSVTGDYWKDTDTSTWYKYNGSGWDAATPPTVKELLDDIFGATLSCYSHCEAWTVSYDDQTGLISSYMPKDGFRININGSRLGAVRRLLSYTGHMMRAEGDGNIHIYLPVTSGEVYDYEYKLNVETFHQWYAKSYKNTLPVPNRVVTQTFPNAYNAYSGSAQVTGYASLPSQVQKTSYYQAALASNSEGNDLAAAILSKVELNSQKGGAYIPICNVGAEVGDYVKITDAREGQDRAGNIASLVRKFIPAEMDPHTGNITRMPQFSLEFTFGGWQTADDILQLLETYSDSYNDFESISARNVMLENLDAYWIDPEGNIDLDKIGDDLDNLADGETYGRLKLLHLDAGTLKLDEYVQYAANYNPTEKFDLNNNDLDDIPEGVSYNRVLSTHISAGKILLLSDTQVDASFTLDKVYDGTTYKRVLSTDISSGHLMLTANTVISGQWYTQSGVVLHASYGISLYGGIGTNALRTFPTYADQQAGTNIQCYVGTDGKFYAGGGSVKLDSTGASLYGQMLKFYYSTTQAGWIYADSSYLTFVSINSYSILIQAASGYTYLASHLYPNAHGARNLGAANPAFLNGYFSGTVYATTFSGNASTATYATSAGNADTLDTYHASSFLLLAGGTMNGSINMNFQNITNIATLMGYSTLGQIGSSGQKFLAVYSSNYPACENGFPTSLNALAIIDRIKKPIIKHGDHGERAYYEDELLPEELKMPMLEWMETEDGDGVLVDMGHDEGELLRTAFTTTQGLYELLQRVKVLESELALLKN